MAWIWWNPPEEKFPVWAEYDHGRSSFQSYRLLSSTRINPGAGRAYLRMRGYKVRQVESFGCLPNTCLSPLVEYKIEQVILDIVPQAEVQFYPAIVIADDGETDKFRFVVPFLHIGCIDTNRSDIVDWMIGGESILSYRSLKHRAGCLGEHNIARDVYFRSHILLSENLKINLENTGTKGLAFYQPEELKPWGFGV